MIDDREDARCASCPRPGDCPARGVARYCRLVAARRDRPRSEALALDLAEVVRMRSCRHFRRPDCGCQAGGSCALGLGRRGAVDHRACGTCPAWAAR